MIDDSKRREVARRLRELADYCDENEMSLSDDDWPGILSDYIWPEDGGYHIYDDDCRRLADLIDPGESGQNLDKNRDTVQIESPAVQKAPAASARRWGCPNDHREDAARHGREDGRHRRRRAAQALQRDGALGGRVRQRRTSGVAGRRAQIRPSRPRGFGGGVVSDIDWRRKLADGLRIDLNELETVVEEMHAAYPDSRDSAMCLIEDWEGRIRAAIGMVDGD